MQASDRPSDLSEAFAECERLVRDGDPDRYVSTSFAPGASRAGLLALYAFNLETARVRDLVSQPLPGEIRLQWWRDRIDAAAADPAEVGQGSPVAAALIHTIRSHALPVDAFDRFLEARIFDLYDDPMPSRQAFEAYAGETASALIMLAAMVLDRGKAAEIADVAGHSGVAQAATGTLRHLAVHRARGQIYVPAEILEASGVSREAWLRGGDEALPAVGAWIAFAREHAGSAGRQLPAVPQSVRSALLPALLSDRYLGHFERTRPGTREARDTIGPLRRSWIYWRSMRA